MSYDIRLKDPMTGKTIEFNEPHQIRGATYQLGGSSEAWLNVTYNYGGIFQRAFGSTEGIRSIYGMSGDESLQVLNKAILSLKDDVSDNYWDATDGNAKRVLLHLRAFATMRPDGEWDGD